MLLVLIGACKNLEVIKASISNGSRSQMPALVFKMPRQVEAIVVRVSSPLDVDFIGKTRMLDEVV